MCRRANKIAQAFTVNEYDGHAQLQRLPDLHLAVRPLEHADAQEQHKSGTVLDAVQHALLGKVRGPVVVCNAEVRARSKDGNI